MTVTLLLTELMTGICTGDTLKPLIKAHRIDLFIKSKSTLSVQYLS